MEANSLEVLGVPQWMQLQSHQATRRSLQPLPQLPLGLHGLGSEDCTNLRPYLAQEKATPSSRIFWSMNLSCCVETKTEKNTFQLKRNGTLLALGNSRNFLQGLKTSG